MRAFPLLTAILALAAAPLCAEDFTYKERLIKDLAGCVPTILGSFDAKTGRFGRGIWICTDQHSMVPLAVAYATKHPENPYYKKPEILEVIVKAGDALIADADQRGMWVFRKKDGSTWGDIWMPWTYSRWIRTFALVRDDMPADRRKAWEDALTLGYKGISGSCLGHLHNIPTHHAMGLYIAGKTLDRPEWRRQAAEFMAKVIAAQSEGGYWSEGVGPVVAYNFVYIDALGTYYAVSGDQQVLPALEKAALFHRYFTYPNGHNVETVDQRNPYHASVELGNVGFTHTPIGRAYLRNQWACHQGTLDADLMASLVLYGEEGPLAPTASEDRFVLREGAAEKAAVIRSGPWFVCLSAYTAPIVNSRWIQDRQNFISVYHDQVGLVLGGGNTKLQPAWSNFTVGDPSLLKHTPGDENPVFTPKGGLIHVPSAARLLAEPGPGLELTYGQETCRIHVRIVDERKVEFQLDSTAKSGQPVAARLTALPRLGRPFETAAGTKGMLDNAPLELTAQQIGGWFGHGGVRLGLPSTATAHWPALPHNPYRKDGRANADEGRIEVRIPWDSEHSTQQVTLEIGER
ncbi:MAG: hypothetical protein HUU20_06265 [Pirellulales bacterium]|nr:hypothetical protein [Pirellulales bacterium]